MFGRSFVAYTAFAFAIAVAACSLTTTNPGTSDSPPSSGGASGAQVDQCKQSCDKMKFFSCNSADEQAACYADCEKATADQIQLFDGCADNSVCDPACRTNITPKTPSGQPATGSGASASTCSAACAKLVQCSIITPGDTDQCNGECTSTGYQYQIDCINGTPCASLKTTCGGGTSTTTGDAGIPDVTVLECQSNCDQFLSFQCFSASDQSTCRNLCASATSAKRNTFNSCAGAAVGDCNAANACYASFTD